MNAIETIVSRMRENADAPAVVWNGAEITYDSLLRLIEAWESRLRGIGVGPGTVCAIVSDYSPETVALFFALMRRRSIMVPLLRDAQEPIDRFLDIAGVEVVIRIDDEDGWDSEPRHNAVTNVLVAEFRDVRAQSLALP